MGDGSNSSKTAIDPDKLRGVIGEHPVRCALLFGSRARGTATASSDVDIAGAFDERLSDGERLEQRIELTTELSKSLGIDDVEVTDLDQVRPEVGRSVLETGTVLFGDNETVEGYRNRFEREATDESHDDRMRRFDDVLDRLEGRV